MADISNLIDPVKFGLNPNRSFTATTEFTGGLRVQQELFGGDIVLDVTRQGGERSWEIGFYVDSYYGDETVFTPKRASSARIATVVAEEAAKLVRYMAKAGNRTGVRNEVREANAARAARITEMSTVVPAEVTLTGEDITVAYTA